MRTLFAIFMLATTLAGNAADTNGEADKAASVAVTFINGYVNASRARNWDRIKWVAASPLATNNFKRTLKKMISDGFKRDPEVGLDSDPVVGGNDCPDSYTVKSAKADGDAAAVVLIGPKDFPAQVKVRMLKVEGKWLVDACGDMLR